MSRVVLVTGGTRGIGAATCIAFKKAGYKIVANYAHSEKTAQDFNRETGITIFKWDVSKFDECARGVAVIEKELGAVEILVNNAGIVRDSMMHKMSYEQWNEVISTNLTSCYNMCHAVIPGMRENKFGRIINISSINAQSGQLGQTNYAAAKAGIFGFTKALALESAVRGITVNAVAPGYIDTEMVHSVPEEIIKKIVAQIPVGRLGKPEEIARSVLFLASDEAGFITGETISVNGGHHME